LPQAQRRVIINGPAFSNESRTRRKQALKAIALNAPNNIKGTIYQWDMACCRRRFEGLWLLLNQKGWFDFFLRSLQAARQSGGIK